MSVGSEGLLNWYRASGERLEQNQGTIILDVDAAFSDVAVVMGRELVFTRCIRVGSDQLEEDRQQ